MIDCLTMDLGGGMLDTSCDTVRPNNGAAQEPDFSQFGEPVGQPGPR